MAKGKKKKTELQEPAATTKRVATPKVKFEAPKPQDAGGARALTFGAGTYKWMGIGFGLVVLGLILMAGSRGDNFNEFDPEVIYSPIKTTVAPALMLAGLGVTIFAILKK